MLGTFCSYDDIPDLLKQPKVHLTDLSAYTSSQTDPRSSLLPHILLPYLLSTHQIPRNLLVSHIIPSSALFSPLLFPSISLLFPSPLFSSFLSSSRPLIFFPSLCSSLFSFSCSPFLASPHSVPFFFLCSSLFSSLLFSPLYFFLFSPLLFSSLTSPLFVSTLCCTLLFFSLLFSSLLFRSLLSSPVLVASAPFFTLLSSSPTLWLSLKFPSHLHTSNLITTLQFLTWSIQQYRNRTAVIWSNTVLLRQRSQLPAPERVLLIQVKIENSQTVQVRILGLLYPWNWDRQLQRHVGNCHCTLRTIPAERRSNLTIPEFVRRENLFLALWLIFTLILPQGHWCSWWWTWVACLATHWGLTYHTQHSGRCRPSSQSYTWCWCLQCLRPHTSYWCKAEETKLKPLSWDCAVRIIDKTYRW